MLTFDQALAKALTLSTEAEFLQLIRETSASAAGNKMSYSRKWCMGC